MAKHAELPLSWLRAFVAVADLGKEESAATFLGISQGTVNKNHRALSKWLQGPRLLEGRPLKLTDAGAVFLPVARNIIDQLDASLPNFQTAVPFTKSPPVSARTLSITGLP